MDEQTSPVAIDPDMINPDMAGTMVPDVPAVPAETFLGLDTYAWIGLAFVSFLLVLKRTGAFAWIIRALDRQADKVRSDLAEAANLKAEAEAMRAKAAADAAQAEAGARAMLANAEIEAQRIVEQAGIDAEATISRRTKIAEDRIQTEARAAEAQIRARVAGITVKAALTLLAERTAKGELADLTDAAIAGLDQH